MAEEKFNTLQTFTFLSKALEDSRLQILSEVDNRFVDENRDKQNIDEPLSRRSYYYVLSEEEKITILQKLDDFSDYLHLTQLQTMVFIALFTVQIEDSRGNNDFDNITRFYGIKTLDAIPLKMELNTLIEKEYLKKSVVANTIHRRMSDTKIDSMLEKAILNNQPFQLSKPEEMDRYKFCQLVSDEIERRSEDEISTNEMFKTVKKLEEKYDSLSFIKKVSRKLKKIEDRTLFYEVCDDYTMGGDSGIDCTLSDMYDSNTAKFRVASAIFSDKHILIKLGLVEKKPASFFSKASMTLTDDGMELYLEKDYNIISEMKKEDKQVILPEKIAAKQLFYSDELQRQISFFQNSLDDKQFNNLQKRLEEKAMPKGVCAIFYGVPGTGKTETALQIARATGRKVIHVDISASKTCWYGESEKLIKKIFTNYATKCKKEKKKPILLFNEADALFGRRNENVSRSVDQTENAIQNIILEEMEKLDGILIATTNLADNLDDAFERRFLFKVKFEKPSIEAKKLIWKDKMPNLCDEDCEKLAKTYDFSGGEIDNIVRKSTMKEVLEGTILDYNYIEELCKTERLSKKGHKVVGY